MEVGLRNLAQKLIGKVDWMFDAGLPLEIVASRRVALTKIRYGLECIDVWSSRGGHFGQVEGLGAV
jgi:hypothetical protein